VRELAKALTGPEADLLFDQHRRDLTWFLDTQCDQLALREDHEDYERNQTPASKAAAFRETYGKLKELRFSTPLVDWLLTFQSPAPEAKQHALAEWKKTHQPYWLVSAISKADGREPEAAELVAAAEAIQPDSPAWESANYHRLRLMIAMNKAPEARRKISEAMPRVLANGSASSMNAYTGLRMLSAPDMAEFLRYAPRKVLERNSQEQYAQDECVEVMKYPKRKYDCIKDDGPMQFSDDAVGVFNQQLPLSVLIEASTSPEFPVQLRRSIVLMAWVRSVLVKDDAAATKLFPLLPAKLQEQSKGGTGFQSIVAIVRNPGLSPYLDAGVQRSYSYDFVESYRDNWCWDYEQPSTGIAAQGAAAFLSAKQRSEGEQLKSAIASKSDAETYLGREVLAYARDHRDDPDVPEALFLVLRMVRYSCGPHYSAAPVAFKAEQGKVEEIQKDASRLLRQRYAASPWTKKAAPFAR
jgi:hypothetical protein